MHFHLGRKRVLKDSRTLRLARYLNPAHLPPILPETHWGNNIPPAYFPIYLNDQLGDCTVAGAAHLITTITFNTGLVVLPTDGQVLTMYEASGYKPSDPRTDQGWDLLGASKYLHNTGLAGVKVNAFAEVNSSDTEMLRRVVALFGGAYAGVELPQSAIDDFGKTVWSDTQDKRMAGGHCMHILDYNTTGPIYTTWGQRQQATWAWYLTYNDEVVVLLFYDWITKNGISPSGFNQPALEADLQVVQE